MGAASRDARRTSLAQLPDAGPLDVLIDGIGTGLDLPLLPPAHRYVGLDLVPAMLDRAQPRVGSLDLNLVRGDSQRLPFRAASFDAVVLHLIVAVVPDPVAALAEAVRVTRPGGRLLVLDKFLQPGAQAPLRRALNPLVRRVATRLDVVFEDVLARVPGVEKVRDEPAMAGGWFRHITLVREAQRG